MCATPATRGFDIFDKLEVLEHTMPMHGDGTNWIDQREIAMLGGIKADLCRFNLR